MKKIYLIVTCLFILALQPVIAQTPQKMSYQAVVRNASNDLVTNQSVGIKISILQGSATGTPVYVETQTPTTNANGLVSMEIGNGTVVNGDFTTINWANGPYFIKTETDPAGGANYTITGTSQLLSVPYALYAEKADNVFSGDFNDLSNVPSGLSDGDDVNDADHDPSNEIQTISKTGNTITLSNGGGNVTDSDTHLSDADIAAMGYIKDANDADHDPSNEIQTISKTGNTITLSNGGGNVTDSDTHLSDADIAAMGYIKDANDADHDATNEIQTLSVSGNQLSISSGNSVTLPTGATKLDDLSDAKSDNGSSIFIGVDAGANDQSNNQNVGIGYQAMQANTSGYSNTATGYQTMYSNTTGYLNTANGYKALYSNTTGFYNVATGYRALYSNTTGHSNVAMGVRALYKNTDRSHLVAVGDSALYHNGEGATVYWEATNNTAFGSKALYSNTTGYSNTATGLNALYSNTTGHSNTATGLNALYSNTTGDYNTATGYRALYSNTTGASNTATGLNALHYNTMGHSNTATGWEALLHNTTGSNNTASGYWALYNMTTGNYNTAIGREALYNNTGGSSNTAIGYAAYFNGIYSNSTAIGAGTNITANAQVRLGNSSVTSIGGYANWTNVSDARFKTDVQEDVPGLEFIKKLRPVTYHLDMDAIAKFNHTPDSLRLKDAERQKAAMIQTGFIAQEVEQAAQSLGYDFSGVDKPKNENDYYGLRYAEFVVPLVKAMQEQQKTIEQQQKEIDELKSLVKQLLNKTGNK